MIKEKTERLRLVPEFFLYLVLAGACTVLLAVLTAPPPQESALQTEVDPVSLIPVSMGPLGFSEAALTPAQETALLNEESVEAVGVARTEHVGAEAILTVTRHRQGTANKAALNREISRMIVQINEAGARPPKQTTDFRPKRLVGREIYVLMDIKSGLYADHTFFVWRNGSYIFRFVGNLQETDMEFIVDQVLRTGA